ncbi:hypothetical protein G3O06_01070 [Burkholderia sp. Ac-20345]|uniref:hypothetical protein n=1 Tax=Burkholderia sp. Ac-20345 TaxID=2703891 RepID=UPI00197B83D5|nr:hypothetical protein [Burkholderia sp. Ac-20345]MBN3776156.1 hypothetical protein [Burkholderia sp. Ac-20345]
MDTNIKNAPQRIYLNVGDLPPGEFEFAGLHEVSWCADKQGDSDIEYALVAPAPSASRQEAGKALSSEGPLERPFNDVMAEISAVRPLVDQFIQARGGDISGISYADLLAFASSVRRETLSGDRAAVPAGSLDDA